MAQQKAIDEAYDKAVAKADNLFRIEQYEEAEKAYNEALEIKSGEVYPMQKIMEIQRIRQEKEMEASQDQVVEKSYQYQLGIADSLFENKLYTEAIEAYNEALTIKTEEEYPKGKIDQIKKIMAAQEKARAEREAKRKEFEKTVAKADSLLQEKKYNEAKQTYNIASNIFPDDPYPKQKIEEINKLQKTFEQALQEAKIRDQKYNEYLKQANDYLKNRKYEDAKTAYQKALEYRPDEELPKRKITQINKILAEKARLTSGEKSKTEVYLEMIHLADSLSKLKDYISAQAFYEKASELMPDDNYPKNKNASLQGIISKSGYSNEQKCKKAIADADKLFNQKNYSAARILYQKALEYDPTEIHAKSRIKQIENQ